MLSTGEALRGKFDPLFVALGARRRLLLSPDGGLARLPFEVLPGTGGQLLLDEYRISYLGCGRDALRFGATAGGTPAEPVVIADPAFAIAGPSAGSGLPRAASPGGSRQPGSRSVDSSDYHFAPLPASREEGLRISALLGVRPWLQGEALESRLRQARSPRVLHLATHGFFLQDNERKPEQLSAGLLASGGRLSGPLPENPLLRSGLALAGAQTWLEGQPLPPEAEDGLLTAEDVMGLDLLNTELVVLSACDTGLGEVRTGEGVFGLRRAFIVAGARALVMSLWKVPDVATAVLMERLYRNLLERKLPVAGALREAQSHVRNVTVGELRGNWLSEEVIGRLLTGEDRADAWLRSLPGREDAERPFAEPRFWGAFICQGDPK